MKLENKVAIITGATAGMGKAMAKLFAKEGASCVLLARREERLKEVVKEIEAEGGVAIACKGDVSIQEDVDNAVAIAIENFGKIDILINNAGIMDSFKKVTNVDDEFWNKILDVNLTGPMRLFRAVIPKMIENEGGSIVTVGSVGGISGKISGAAYTASKHGVIGLAKNVAWMYKENNIRSNIIAPGAVDTEISASMDPAQMDLEGYGALSAFYEMVPQTGQSEDIAQLALFLASDDSKFISGDVIKADAGWTV